MMVFLLVSLSGLIIYAGLALAFALSSPARVPQLEKLARGKISGLIVALLCCSRCVEIAGGISPFPPAAMWAMAVALPILCYFFIDFYLSRSAAFAAILYGYDLVHYAFDHHFVFTGCFALLAWLSAVPALILAGRPFWLRDLFRRSAEKKRCRYCCSGYCLLMALTAAGGIVCSFIFK